MSMVLQKGKGKERASAVRRRMTAQQKQHEIKMAKEGIANDPIKKAVFQEFLKQKGLAEKPVEHMSFEE